MIRAFTLAELLIAVGVISLITTFTVPKLLNNYQTHKFNAQSKEALQVIVRAIYNYKAEYGTVNGLTGDKLLPYIGYSKLFPAGYEYDYISGAPITCPADRCLELHNGALVNIDSGYCSRGQLPENQDGFNLTVDPDGKRTNPSLSLNHNQAIQFWIYRNGRIRTRSNNNNPTYSYCDTSYNFAPAGSNPPWFEW